MTRNQERLLELAGLYKGLSRRKLAQRLGRDASNLLPANGNPKLDYLVRLAGVLDWPVGEVAEAILGDGHDEQTPGNDERTQRHTFEDLDGLAKAAHCEGEYARMVELAGQMTAVAKTADDRALAALREAGGWGGLGRHTATLEAVQRGLVENVQSPDVRMLLQVNLANAHYALWHLLEARGMAREILDDLELDPPASRAGRASQAFARYVLGNACRRLLGRHADAAQRYAQMARAALQQSYDSYMALADEFDHEPWRGIANTCRGGIIEVEVELGDLAPDRALAQLIERIETLPDSNVVGDQLESYGWWCVFGCNITLRHLEGRDLQRSMAVLTTTGCEIAERLDNWAMRERLLTLELGKREHLNDLAGVPVDWMLGETEVKTIVGTMGRFPCFRNTGWRILQAATVAKT